MLTELAWLDEWIPEQMEPGTLFVLEKAESAAADGDPYLAVLACPRCGSLGLIKRTQLAGLEPMICGSDTCSAEYSLQGDSIVYRRPH